MPDIKNITMRYFVFLLMTLSACSLKRQDCIVTANDILYSSDSNKVYIAYSKNNVIKGISDKNPKGSARGAYYFTDQGILESYKFFHDSVAYTYNEEYNKSGYIIKFEGNPLVNSKVREVNHDSARITGYFFSLNKEYDNLKVSIGDSIQFELPLTTDSLLSNMKTASFGLSTRNVNHFTVCFSIKYINECTGQDAIITDTMKLVKNPRLNFAP